MSSIFDNEVDAARAKVNKSLLHNGIENLNTIRNREHELASVVNSSPVKPPVAIRHKLPKTRRSDTMTFRLFYNGEDEEQFYLTVGLYPDGSPGELFIHTSKSGSTMKGLLDTWAITMSIALQHGVPLKAICDKLSFVSFEPSGNTGPEFGYAKSAIDYIVRWMAKRYLKHDYREVK